jgi:four helix bundle protein
MKANSAVRLKGWNVEPDVLLTGRDVMQLRQPDLRSRTKALSLRVMNLCRELPPSADAQLLGKRLLRSATRAGAFYRAALRCRSLRSYVKRLESAIYDLELAAYWLELLIDGEVDPKINFSSTLADVQEIITILVACRRKAKKAGRKELEMSSN